MESSNDAVQNGLPHSEGGLLALEIQPVVDGRQSLCDPIQQPFSVHLALSGQKFQVSHAGSPQQARWHWSVVEAEGSGWSPRHWVSPKSAPKLQFSGESPRWKSQSSSNGRAAERAIPVVSTHHTEAAIYQFWCHQTWAFNDFLGNPSCPIGIYLPMNGRMVSPLSRPIAIL